MGQYKSGYNRQFVLLMIPKIDIFLMLCILVDFFPHLDANSGVDVKADENGGANVKVEEETPEYEILEEEELGEEKLLNSIAVEKKEEEKKTLKVEQEDEEKVLTGDEEEDEDEQMDSTPADVLDACVVKYSVKTTPFLQR